MVHQILADAGEVHQRVDAKLVELRLGSQTGAVEDVGTAVGAAADNDLLGSLDLDDRAILGNGAHARRLEGPVAVLLDNDLVHVRLNQEIDIGLRRLCRDEVGARGANALVHRPRGVAASVWEVAVGEHVVVQR